MSAVAARKAAHGRESAGARRGRRAPTAATDTQDPSTSRDNLLTVRIPFKLTPRGGRKLVVGPPGQEAVPSPEYVDSAIVKALARAFRWRKLIEAGVYDGVDHIARAEKINSSYVSRILRLTLLAPIVVEAALGGRLGHMQLSDLLIRLPTEWGRQERELTISLVAASGL